MGLIDCCLTSSEQYLKLFLIRSCFKLCCLQLAQWFQRKIYQTRGSALSWACVAPLSFCFEET